MWWKDLHVAAFLAVEEQVLHVLIGHLLYTSSSLGLGGLDALEELELLGDQGTFDQILDGNHPHQSPSGASQRPIMVLSPFLQAS